MITFAFYYFFYERTSCTCAFFGSLINSLNNTLSTVRCSQYQVFSLEGVDSQLIWKTQIILTDIDGRLHLSINS